MLPAILSSLVLHQLQPAWAGKLSARIRPNPYAPNLPDQHRAAAAQEANAWRASGELVGSLTGSALLSGSEEDYWTHDALVPGPTGWADPIAQDVSGNPGKPASWFIPGDPGADPDEALTLADFDRSPNPNMTPWGGSTRTVNTGLQHVLARRINPPTMVTPSAAVAYTTGPSAAPADVFDRLWSD